MEASSTLSANALILAKSAAGPRLPSSWATPACLASNQSQPHLRLSSSSSSTSRAAVRAFDKQQLLASEEDTEILDSGEFCTTSVFGSLTSEHKTLMALLLSLGFALGSAEAAMALGPDGPLVEEFWDNMRRYGLYFLTVFTGGLYSLLQPIFTLLRNPLTAVLTIAVISGSFYLLFLLLNTMLGITSFEYNYA